MFRQVLPNGGGLDGIEQTFESGGFLRCAQRREFFEISSVTGLGVKELVSTVARRLEHSRQEFKIATIESA